VTAPMLAFTEARSGDRVEVAVVGEVDLATKDSLVGVATRVIKEGPALLVLNLAGVPFIDSTGLSSLIKIRSVCDEAGCALELSNIQDRVAKLLSLTGLGTYLNAMEPEVGV
jgi:anti-sigma B factor antagonist